MTRLIINDKRVYNAYIYGRTARNNVIRTLLMLAKMSPANFSACTYVLEATNDLFNGADSLSGTSPKGATSDMLSLTHTKYLWDGQARRGLNMCVSLRSDAMKEIAERRLTRGRSDWRLRRKGRVAMQWR